MTSPNIRKNPVKNAIVQLHDQKRRLTDLHAQVAAITTQLDEAEAVIAAANGPANDVAVLRQRRREALAILHLDGGGEGAVKRLEAEIAAAEAKALVTERKAEAAAAAGEVLRERLRVVADEIALLDAKLPEMIYFAHLAHACEALEPYRMALQTLVATLAVIQGRCLAADRFSDLQADPRRLLLIGGNAVSKFSAVAPSLPGVNALDYSFNLTDAIEQAANDALVEIGSE